MCANVEGECLECSAGYICVIPIKACFTIHCCILLTPQVEFKYVYLLNVTCINVHMLETHCSCFELKELDCVFIDFLREKCCVNTNYTNFVYHMRKEK